jgi:glycosyltransferase involved in cell wall biosynthesis
MNISVLIPTKNRIKVLKETLDSLISEAHDLNSIEFLIMISENDKAINEYTNLKAEYEKLCNIKLFFNSLTGYANLHHYYNELAKIASGKWFCLFTDDILITKDWDFKIFNNGYSGTRILFATDYFPIVPKELYNVLGHISLSPHFDTWWQDLSRCVGIKRFIDVKIKHVIDGDIFDATRKESAIQYQPDWFFSNEGRTALKIDVDKLKSYLNLDDYHPFYYKIFKINQIQTIKDN